MITHDFSDVFLLRYICPHGCRVGRERIHDSSTCIHPGDASYSFPVFIVDCLQYLFAGVIKDDNGIVPRKDSQNAEPVIKVLFNTVCCLPGMEHLAAVQIVNGTFFCVFIEGIKKIEANTDVYKQCEKWILFLHERTP